MMNEPNQTATFDLVVDGEVRATVVAESRNEATRLLGAMAPETRSGAFQDRAKVKVRDHEHAPAAGNMGVCVFCQADIAQTASKNANARTEA